ncbi:hypothetical protein [Sphingomonas nostoxanthinifaciens]|uniref:hypothetical protein n=1 Tax=Sphingomonas nostoxanthinifaciens TaxID=2872652 RepID=UPI001CC20774|nr:hypothetical protein [Sphingomonas nostoxanthinifaciens]UAK24669.1 hypothetical protein K8P63_00100 [Sphingomonas nostoxanthinifaciens]
MSAHVAISADDAHPVDAAPPHQRQDGWTAERRRSFIALVAEGATVEAACARVGLSVASAYALRRRAGGAAFAMGWAAACLLARERLADVLMSRALDGQVDTYTRADGSVVTRHRHDNRLAMAMLTRLDRLADPRLAEPTGDAAADAADPVQAARTVAGDFDAFLGVVGTGDDAAAAHAFVSERIPQLPQLRAEEPAPRAARAADPDGEDDEEDYDEDEEEDEDDAHEEHDGPVWYDPEDDALYTNFPPPPHFAAVQYGTFGDADYARLLTPEEEDAFDAREECGREQAGGELDLDAGIAARDAFFGFEPPADGGLFKYFPPGPKLPARPRHRGRGRQ